MARIGLISRIALTVMVLLLAAILSALGFHRWNHAHWPKEPLTRASFMGQAAAIIDVVRQAKPDDLPVLLRAVSVNTMRADILDRPPPLHHLFEAPQVTAKVKSLMQTSPPPFTAYSDGDMHGLAYPHEGLEGIVRRVVVPMPTGKYLVIDTVRSAPDYSLQMIFGMPSGFWIGILGFLVAALAFVAALRELGPVRRLTEAVTRFDGRTAQAIAAEDEASDLGRLVRAVGEMQTRVATLVHERSFLIGAISHDAKTYLTRLRLRAEDICDIPRRAAMVRDIDAMAELIDTSLAYARGTMITPHRGPVDLADLVAAEVAERDALGPKRIVLGALAEDAIVEGDPVALKRVVANLVENALKFGASRVEGRGRRRRPRRPVPGERRRRWAGDRRGRAGRGLQPVLSRREIAQPPDRRPRPRPRHCPPDRRGARRHDRDRHIAARSRPAGRHAAPPRCRVPAFARDCGAGSCLGRRRSGVDAVNIRTFLTLELYQ